MKRRKFFQRTSHLLTLLGASWLGSGKSGLANPLLVQYEKNATPLNRRKLALLVGINQYSSPLAGCVTDVELQRELLIYRFGFEPSDIVVLTDSQGSREQIETAFREHLVKQAQADDLVVFHFSGYGTRIPLASGGKVQNALVTLETGTNGYLDWDDLQQLMRSLPTQKILTVLDTSFSHSQLQLPPNLHWRGYVAPADRIDEVRSLSNPKLPGILLQASENELVAAEKNWGGFTTGIFTYSLTQELWTATDATSISVTFQQTAAQIDELVGKWQKPSLQFEANRYNSIIAANSQHNSILGAEGAIIALDDRPNYVKVWLGGLPTHLVADYGLNSVFTTIGEPENASIILQIRAREGLTAKAKIHSSGSTSPSLIGQPIQEVVRVISRQIGLVIGLNPELERIERVDATSALSNIPTISSVVNVGEQSADYWFGKQPQTLKTGESAYSYALFSLNGDFLPETLGTGNEAIKVAANRLRQPLNQLLATKMWELTENQTTSRLGVKATLETTENSPKTIAQKQTKRSNLISRQLIQPNSTIPNLSPQTSLRYRLENFSDRPIYWLIVGVDANHNPITWEPSKEAIAPGTIRIIPEPSANQLWLSKEAAGLAEIYLICSIAPFDKAIATIQTQIKGKGLLTLPAPLEVAQAVLEDLHQASTIELATIPSESLSAITDAYALDVNSWATLRFVYKCT
ncbi:caspase family protein [Merismopedia glauca]|uniref:Peptidase C14 n=1 Tax=Merismopedia glauca CCAP 1448/3 TaxID=1296344 RepID=A0A2T1C7A9_9CYAN|nr:caspase family protein [Merismopedia glauca]PSB04048.1 peptidase C14 [Merismopedia glauca CCAP 1448/3]